MGAARRTPSLQLPLPWAAHRGCLQKVTKFPNVGGRSMQLSLKRLANLKLTSCAIAAVLLLGGRHVAVSQITTAAIHGTVTDPSGAVVPNAKIAAVNTSTGIETDTTSNGSGFYFFPTLQIGGPYTVTIDALGFSEV